MAPRVVLQDHRHFEFAAGHVVNLGRLIHELIHRQSDEIPKHDVYHRSHPGHGGADADAAYAGFGDGRIDDAFRAKFFHQAGKHFERSSGFGDILADDEDRGSRRISSASASLMAWPKVISRTGFRFLWPVGCFPRPVPLPVGEGMRVRAC